MCKIFIVDPDIETHRIVSEAIPDAEIFFFDTSRAAMDHFRRLEPDITLVAASMEEDHGFSVIHFCADLGAGQHPRRLIAVAGTSDPEFINASFNAGASDIMVKPLHPRFVESRLRDMMLSMRVYRSKQTTEMKLEAIMEIFPDPVTVTEYDSGAYVHVNKAFLDRIQKPTEAVVGSNPVSLGLITQEDRQRLLRALEVVGEVKNLDIPYTTNGKTHWMSISAKVFVTGGERYILTVTRDLTIQKDILARNEVLRESVDRRVFKEKLGKMRERTSSLREKVDILRGVTLPDDEPDSGT